MLDEMANTAFWLGVMCGMPEECKDLSAKVEFEEARYNFYNAARRGLESQFNWFGEIVPARELILNRLIPIARNGLKMKGVNKSDIDRLLSVIEGRMINGVNGATWQLNNFGRLMKDSTPNEASVQLTRRMFENQASKKAVHEWEDILFSNVGHKKFTWVKDVMETDLYTVKETDSIDLVVNVMDWHGIRHIPVENKQNKLVGMINTRSLIHFLAKGEKHEDKQAKDVMVTDYEVTNAHELTARAVAQMADKRVDALAVVNEDGQLIGLMTESDVLQVLRLTGILISRTE